MASASSAAVARRFVSRNLSSWGYEDPGETAALLTSEMVTNAVVHGRGDVGLSMAVEAPTDTSDGLVRIETSDESPDVPVMKDPVEAGESGRGLYLVQALARRWGTRRRAGGKVVWFELLLARLPGPPRPTVGAKAG